MSNCPENLRYTKSHEWINLEEDNTVTMGITDYAQSMLGDLVYVELPDASTQFEAGDEMAVVESVKTAADVYSPISGEIIAVNDALEETPETVNQDPYGKGWLVRIKMANADEFQKLMDATHYAKQIED